MARTLLLIPSLLVLLKRRRRAKSMALTHLLLLLGASLALAFLSGSVTEAGELGVCYGMKARNLIKPPAVVRLLQTKGIKAVALYDTDPTVLSALANSNIKVGVSLPNQYLTEAGGAGGMSFAVKWVQSQVKPYYPSTLITSVAVGNEVFHQEPQLTPQLLPAMKNIHAALVSAGLADAIKVITPIAMDALKDPSFPPSAGEFRDDLAQSVMSPMVDFLRQTGSFLSFNIYPYFAYKADPSIDLNYVLFRPNNGNADPKTGLIYLNMFDAMADAVFHAVEKLGSSSRRQGRMLDSSDDALLGEIGVKESGYGSGIFGRAAAPLMKHDDNTSEIAASQATSASTANAQIYNTNLIGKILRGDGTPYKPNAVISANIFSLFNEDLKPGPDDERHFGLFNPDGTPVYEVDFVVNRPVPAPSPARPSWCVANAAVGDKRLQDALDFACGSGADCTAIQPGKPCYQPNTLVAHASYAFDSYYQAQRRVSGSCNFNGAGSVVFNKPSTCDANTASWCVAKTTVGDTNLQNALDFACGHGADCSAIQAGGRCFNPNTKVAHASYAFNSYYQKNGRSDQSCDFNGCGTVVHQAPSCQ